MYESAEGRHRHKCGLCHWVWEHDESCAGREDEHRCPECGYLGDANWYRYHGETPPGQKGIAGEDS